MNRESERKKLRDTLSWIRYKLFPSDEATTEFIIDSLLRDGIIAPPCKVGDKVWLISENGSYVYDTDVEIVFCDRDGCYIETIQNDVFTDEDFGKTVFTSREEAEKMLKGKEDEGEECE